MVHVFWLPRNAEGLDQIEIWSSTLQRKLLQPNHFASVDVLVKDIPKFIAHYDQTAKPIRWTYTAENLKEKLGTI